MRKKHWDRPSKNHARTLAEPTAKKKFTLWFPGEDALDVINAKKKKLLNARGKHILVERNKKIVTKIEEALLPDKSLELHVGSLSSLRLERPLEYAHFDFCGGLSRPVTNWMFDKLELAENAEVHFTFSFALRNNLFLKAAKELFWTKPELREVLKYYIVDISRTDGNDPFRIIAFHCSLIRCMLHRYGFQSLEPVWYKDTVQSMVLYRCRRVSRLKQPLLQLDFRSSLMAAKTKKGRREAAIKAHKTRNQKPIQASDVVTAIVAGDKTKKPAIRAVASKLLHRYVAQQKRAGKLPKHVSAAIKAAVTKRKAA